MLTQIESKKATLDTLSCKGVKNLLQPKAIVQERFPNCKKQKMEKGKYICIFKRIIF
jgi:hypothetical protein